MAPVFCFQEQAEVQTDLKAKRRAKLAQQQFLWGILNGGDTILSEQETEEHRKLYTSNLTQMWENRNLETTWTLESKITINRSAEEVFDAITTSGIWRACYPNTISVGGFSRKPFTPQTPQGLLTERRKLEDAFALSRYQASTKSLGVKGVNKACVALAM